MTDCQIEHPQHYNGDTIYECVKVIKAWSTPEEYEGFLKGNILKYICRYEKKNNPIYDLQKAKYYLDLLIQEYDQI